MPSIKADRKQMFLLPPAIEDWIPANHIARFIVAFVEGINLKGIGFKQEEEEGRPSYSSEMLLGVWLYGLMEKTRSSRRIEKALYDSMAMIWISGNEHPDHNTLWRFFKRNKKEIKKILKETVKVAVENEMVGFELQVVDGTKIIADVNKDKTKTIKGQKKKLEKIEEEIEEIIKEVEENEKKDENEGKCRYGIPDGLMEKEELRKKIEESIKRLKEEGKEEENETDKDSRFMKVRHRGLQQAYNSQVVVDSKEQIIVGEEVVNDSTDNHLLTGMIEEAERTTGKESEETMGDMGYYSPEEMEKAEDRSKKVVVNIPDKDNGGRYNKARFKYNEERNEYECAEGGRLEYVGEKKRSSGKNKVMVYQYRCRNYKTCAFAKECSKDKRGRTIEVIKEEVLIRKIKERAKKENWKEKLKSRGKIVEPVFGIIKRVLGIRRFSVRGLENVKSQWSFICAVYNLKKIYGAWVEGKVKLKPVET